MNGAQGNNQLQPLWMPLELLMDVPHEPPYHWPHVLREVRMPHEHRKMRSFFTISKPLLLQPESRSGDLITNGIRAVRAAKTENPVDCFVNYLNEHMNSQNYPNGVGLPHRWGHY